MITVLLVSNKVITLREDTLGWYEFFCFLVDIVFAYLMIRFGHCSFFTVVYLRIILPLVLIKCIEKPIDII